MSMGGNKINHIEKRVHKDRRNQPTFGLSRYTFFGRRKGFQRKEEREKGGYVDRYSSTLFFFVVLILGLNILDALFTLFILDLKGWEANPVVRSVIETYGDKFWIWKFVLVSTCVTLLCLHSRFKIVQGILIALSSIYFMVVCYQFFLLLFL
jgi:hypothetical protein